MEKLSNLFRRKLKKSEQNKIQSDNEPMKLERVQVSPVFKTKEQEKIFAECAQKSMSITSELEWEGKHYKSNYEDEQER